MSPRRRTLCFVVTLFSLNNVLVFVTSVDVGPGLPEYYPSSSLPTPPLSNPFSANRVSPDNLSGTPKIYPNPRLSLNNALPYGPYPQSITPNTIPTFYANPNVVTAYSTDIPPPDKSIPLPNVDQTTGTFYSPGVDSLTIIENQSPITQTVQVDIDSNSFDFPTADVANIYQTPISAQMPATPLVLANPQVTNPLSAGTANRVFPETLPAPQRMFPNPRLSLNNALSYGSSPRSIAPNTVPTFYANPNVLTTYSTYLPPPNKSVPLPIGEQTIDAFYSPGVDSLTIIENQSPITQTVQVDIDSNSFDFPTADVANIYQTPISAQMPATPLVLTTLQVTNPFLVDSANRIFPETLPATQRMFPNPRLSLNAFPYGSYQQDITVSPLPSSCCATPNVYSTYSAYIPPVENTISTVPNPLPLVEQITDSYSSGIDSLTIIENSSPITQTVQVDVDTNSFDFPSANVVDISQTPITVQAAASPQVSPTISVSPPLPEILPAQNYVQDICPQTIEPCTSVPIETPATILPSYDGGCCQPYPITLQVNMPPPYISEPVIAIIPQNQPQIQPQPQPQPAPCSYPSYEPSFGMPPQPQPIIVMEKSNSNWKSILPILLLTLFDGCGSCGGYGNGGGGCGNSQCCTNTPVPFPIMIPVNNPIVTKGRSGRSRGKSKSPSEGDAEVKDTK